MHSGAKTARGVGAQLMLVLGDVIDTIRQQCAKFRDTLRTVGRPLPDLPLNLLERIRRFTSEFIREDPPFGQTRATTRLWTVHEERILIELMTLDRKLKASTKGSK